MKTCICPTTNNTTKLKNHKDGTGTNTTLNKKHNIPVAKNEHNNSCAYLSLKLRNASAYKLTKGQTTKKPVIFSFLFNAFYKSHKSRAAALLRLRCIKKVEWGREIQIRSDAQHSRLVGKGRQAALVGDTHTHDTNTTRM